MATMKKKVLKNGKIHYAIQISITNADGTRSFRHVTWKNEQNLTGVRADQAAQAYAAKCEEEYKSGKVKHKLADHTFKEFAQIWLNTRKHTISDNHYLKATECIKRISNFLGNKKFVELKAYDIQEFFVFMNETVYTTTKAVIKPERQVEFDQIALSYGIHNAIRDSGTLTRPTLYYARLGKHVECESAEAMCKFYNLRFSDYFNKITTERHYRKETIMKYKRVLSSIFNYAISIELVSKNYASSAYVKDVIGGEPAKEIEILSEDEFNALLNSLEYEDLWTSIPIYILLTTGVRSSELCGLKWDDIDLVNKTISIKRNRIYVSGKGVIVKDLKTKTSKRTLAMCNLLFNKLTAFKALYDRLKENDKNFNADGFIFCNTNGTAHFPHHLNGVLKKFLVKAGCRKISCHKLRHTWITRMISNGVAVNTVSKMVGHATSDITLKTYTHYCKDIDNSQEVMEKLFMVG